MRNTNIYNVNILKLYLGFIFNSFLLIIMQDEASAETLYSLTPELDEEIDETIRQELV